MHCLSLQNAKWGSLPPGYAGGFEGRWSADRHSGLTGNLFRIRPVYLHRGHERVYRQGHSAEPSLMTFDLFRLLFDYYTLCDRENSFEPLRRNGSKLFCILPYFVYHTWKPVEIRSIRVRPHNSNANGAQSCAQETRICIYAVSAYHISFNRFIGIFLLLFPRLTP